MPPKPKRTSATKNPKEKKEKSGICCWKKKSEPLEAYNKVPIPEPVVEKSITPPPEKSESPLLEPEPRASLISEKLIEPTTDLLLTSAPPQPKPRKPTVHATSTTRKREPWPAMFDLSTHIERRGPMNSLPMRSGITESQTYRAPTVREPTMQPNPFSNYDAAGRKVINYTLYGNSNTNLQQQTPGMIANKCICVPMSGSTGFVTVPGSLRSQNRVEWLPKHTNVATAETCPRIALTKRIFEPAAPCSQVGDNNCGGNACVSICGQCS
jgi:hypothetical protein